MQPECSLNPILNPHQAIRPPKLIPALLLGCVVSWVFLAGVGAPAAEPVAQAASAPGFSIQRFEVSGDTLLGRGAIDRCMADATGTNVPLPTLKRALSRLQELYRERGLQKVVVTLPRQTPANGVVRVEVHDPAAVREAAPSDPAPRYELRHFEIRGSTVLSAGDIDRILGPLAGSPVDLAQIRAALARLQADYRDRGYTRAEVSLPQQLLTDGTVMINVREGQSLEAERSAFAARTQEAPLPESPKPRVFEVRRYEVSGNTLLKADVLNGVFTNAIGNAVTLQQIQGALGDLQLAYRERGFATVGVGLPQQQLTNAVVKVQVTEGSLVDVRVTGNRYFSTSNVLRALPSVSTNQVLNSRVLQRELDIANQNADRQIYPNLGPGPEPGTSALTLRVKDRLPLHGRVDLSNQATPGTPQWRINASLQYANLWNLEHQMGLSYGFTPEAMKTDGLVPEYFFNRPLIANYGTYYRIPFGAPLSVQQQIDTSAGQFGYNEATHQFRLPPAGPRPDLTFYLSASSSDTGVKRTPLKLESDQPLLTIFSQDSGLNVSVNESAGGRFSYPIILDDNRRFNLSAGLDLKRYGLESRNTNNFLFITVTTNSAGGSITNRSETPSQQPTRYNDIVYLPVSLSADYLQTDPGGTFTAGLLIAQNVLGNTDDFVSSAYTTKARSSYTKATLSLSRDQKVFRDWSLLMRANGQVSTGALISNEQHALGGLNSVRGYLEGDDYGDAGWAGGIELRTPFLNTEVPTWSGPAPVWIRGSMFLDGGQRFLLEPSPGSVSTRSLLGTGLGISANVNSHVDMRIAVGWPLRDSANSVVGEPRAYLSLGGEF